MLSSKETLCRAGIVKIEKFEEIELCTEFPRRSGIVKHTDFRFLVIQKNILLQKIRKNDAICSIHILQTLISREKGKADIENEYPIQLRICVQFSVHFPDPKSLFQNNIRKRSFNSSVNDFIDLTFFFSPWRKRALKILEAHPHTASKLKQVI